MEMKKNIKMKTEMSFSFQGQNRGRNFIGENIYA